MVAFIALRSLVSLVTFIALKGRVVFQAVFIERNERVFLTVFVGHLFRFQSVAEVHTEFVQRHAPVCIARNIYIIFFLTTEVEIQRCSGNISQLCHVDSIGIFCTGGYIGNLAALDNSVSCLIDSVRTYADSRFGGFPCRFQFALRFQSIYEVFMLFFPVIKSLFRFSFFIFRRIIKSLR